MWHVTVAHTMADLHVGYTSRSAGTAAELATSRKSAKYGDLLISANCGGNLIFSD